MSWTFGGASPVDTDGDYINDRKDKCPLTPQGAIVDLTGCPLDGDGDGVPDGIDRCNDSPPGVPVNSTGCCGTNAICSRSDFNEYRPASTSSMSTRPASGV